MVGGWFFVLGWPLRGILHRSSLISHEVAKGAKNSVDTKNPAVLRAGVFLS